ncbi:NTP pyrophosphohydrolase [Desulfosporosinus orientis DSM 765]|uniref:NTP pyrophosphohydrolase n=1 Tax=Desulfosporosinus orientis (strain ATCC 19365 / DSM 765 / NCIMB 8382 / VKM B-1628 / Singapore I) TaxID=768706 RepID=G7WJ71_DESOD|nr:NUDIX hydrolase [Desulfosporosinus orientis]AET70383.1 NTP pyrophosphohydrolase [Desulfosporosinus orientis DSM 765]
MDFADSIKKYVPFNEQEKNDQAIILRCLEVFEDVLTRSNKIAHFTSSAFVVNKSRDKVLVVHHNIYNSWSWTGGHADGETDLLAVAIKELKEETGVEKICLVTPGIFSLDILPVLGHIKRGEYVSPHLHLSAAFLFEADENEPLTVKEDENSGVQWIPLLKLTAYSNEPHMHKVYEKLITKIDRL